MGLKRRMVAMKRLKRPLENRDDRGDPDRL